MYAEGPVDEVDQVGAGGLGAGQEELDDGAGEARQELAVGSAVQAVVRLLDRFLGGQALLAGGRGTADADQAGDLGDLESRPGVEQEMAEQPGRVAVVAPGLAEMESGEQHAALVGCEPVLGDPGLSEPCGEVIGGDGHWSPSPGRSCGEVYSVAARS